MTKVNNKKIPNAEYGQPNRVSVADMLHEIASQSVAVTAVMAQMANQLETLDKQKIREARHVFVTGCGDSYFAGIAARLAFHKYGGILMEPIEAASQLMVQSLLNNNKIFKFLNLRSYTNTIFLHNSYNHIST